MVKNTNQHRSNRKKSLKNDREIMKDQQDPGYSIKHQSEVICFEYGVYCNLPSCQMLQSIFNNYNLCGAK